MLCPCLFGRRIQQVDKCDAPGLLTYIEPRDCDRQIKTARACASRIEEQDAALLRAGRLVRMPAHDNMKSRGGRIQIERLNVVENVNCGGICFDHFGFRKSEGPGLRVHISPHGKNRGQSFQRFENFRIAYITRMNDQVRAFEGA